MATRPPGSKKVRLACRRCRVRRIKCDGLLPACSNCAKAGEICIDVDSQNGDVLLPRDFANTARARISWLEGVIKEHLPDFDLMAGPQIDVPLDNRPHSSTDDGQESISRQHNTDIAAQSRSRKRTTELIESSDEEASFHEGAQSVAMNLGMLALNSDSTQKPYLGSSSGLLFTSLIKAASPAKVRDSISGSEQQISLENGQSVQAEEMYQAKYRSLHQMLRQELPRQEDAMTLVQTFVTEVHPDFPALDPQGLFSALQALYACSSLSLDTGFVEGWPKSLPPFRWNGVKIDPSQNRVGRVSMPAIAFILFMVLNIAAIVKVRMRNYEYPPEKFYRSALIFSGECFSHVNLTSIQALVTIANHAILTPADFNLWTLVHVAMAHCIELGIHREPTQRDPLLHEAYQIQRTVFYSIYSLDRSISSIQGRPLGFRDETFDAKMPDEISSNNDSQQIPVASSLLAAISQYCRLQFKLDRIVSQIKVDLYHLLDESTRSSYADTADTRQKKIAKDLHSWWQDVTSTEFAFQGHEKRRGQAWTLKLQTRYHNTLLLLFQPSQAIRTPSDDSLFTCFKSASIILQNYQILRDSSCLHFGWKAVQNTFAAGATLIYVFWTSKYVQSKVSATEFTKSLRTCSSLLSVGGEWWPAARRCKQSFEAVVDLTIRRLFTINASPKRARVDKRGSVDTSRVQKEPNRSSTSDVHPQSLQIMSHLSTNVSDHISPLQSTSVAGWTTLPGDSQLTNFQNPQMTGLWYGDGNSPGFDVNSEVVPEIQDFLDDFGNSDFSWNFSLTGFDDPYDAGDFFTTGH